MRVLLSWLAVLTVGLLLVASPANAQTKLTYQVKDSESYLTEPTTNVEQTLVLAGMNIVTTANTQAVIRHTSGKRDAAGEITVLHKSESLQIKMSVMGSNYTFDSNNPDNTGNSPLEAVRPIHKAIAKNEMTLTLDKNNKVLRAQLKDDILGGLPAQVQTLVRRQLDPDEIVKKSNQEIGHLPDGEVRTGEKWNRTESIDLGGGQTMTFQVEYTYNGPTNKDGKSLDKISQKVNSVTFTIEGNDLPLTLKESNLKVAESSGTMFFDRTLGRTVESNTVTRITGDLKFEANNMELPSKLDLKLSSSSSSRK